MADIVGGEGVKITLKKAQLSKLFLTTIVQNKKSNTKVTQKSSNVTRMIILTSQKLCTAHVPIRRPYIYYIYDTDI